MIALFFSILFTVLVFVILKEFDLYKLDNFQAIVVSYILAFIIGLFFSESNITISFLLDKKWIYGAIGISIIFITVFNLMAITAQKGGLSVMTIALKMSMVIPITIGVFLYGESLGFLKIAGVLLALIGIWFTTKKTEGVQLDKQFWYLPFLIFLGGGTADTLLNHIQLNFVPKHELDAFSTSLFLFCALIGILVFLIRIGLGNLKISIKSWIGGLILGAPNYFSIYYLVKALAQKEYGTAFTFSAHNLLVVLSSVLLGLWLYKEKLNKQNYLGLGMSILAIVFLYFTL